MGHLIYDSCASAFDLTASLPFRIDSSMTPQPTLFSQGVPVPPSSPDTNPNQLPRENGKQTSGRTPRWLLYLELSIRVVVRLYLGLVLVVLPWTSFWTSNRLLLLVPHLALVALSGITRGIVSGLGLLNIWIGVSDAIHYKQG
jgi:hypothetical protein